MALEGKLIAASQLRSFVSMQPYYRTLSGQGSDNRKILSMSTVRRQQAE